MREKDFPGAVFTATRYLTVDQEAGDLWAGGKKPAEAVVWSTRIDQLRNRVDLSTGPDLTISFTGTGAAVEYPHGLKDSKNAPVAPRFVRLAQFKGLQDFAEEHNATNVKITANTGSSGVVEVYI
jgi:hypothetical protein